MPVKELIFNIHVFGLFGGEAVHEANDDEIIGVWLEVGHILKGLLELIHLELFVLHRQIASYEEVLVVLVDDGQTLRNEPSWCEAEEEYKEEDDENNVEAHNMGWY